MMIAHIVVQPLLWESEEFTDNVAIMAKCYQQISDDRYFMDYLDDKAHGHGHGLTLLASVVLWKGYSFFNTKKKAEEIQAIQDSGVSNWRTLRTKVVREWTRQVRGAVEDYLDDVEKREQKQICRQICRLRSKSEWKELEANTLRNLMDATAPPLKQNSGRVLRRKELSLSLRQKETAEVRLHRVQSSPLPQVSSCVVADLRTMSTPSVLFSDHVEVIELAMELPTEEECHSTETRGTRW
jgi:hypothetical protein